MKTSIWWIRRDLRLADNPALLAAIHNSDQIIPLFIMDAALLNSERAGLKRQAFLWGGLESLEKDLQERGSYLVVRSGSPAAVLQDLLEETGADMVYAQEDFSPYSRKRDNKVRELVPLTLAGSSAIAHPSEVLKKDGSPYLVYTPYKKSWMAKKLPFSEGLIPAPESIQTTNDIRSERIPTGNFTPNEVHTKAGELEAQKSLREFADSGAMGNYDHSRDRMDLPGTSQLSPYLRFGMLSLRQATLTAADRIETGYQHEDVSGAETWLSELIWREFYTSILYHYPNVMNESFRPEYRNIEWVNDRWEFERWQIGETGYPVVDAGMRQLAQTGWMHNRARMISASFLVKDLLIDWRWGELWFMQQLIDGDPAANNGGWQWTAGTGTDAAPYFRIFNPTTQGKRFDPAGHYVRRWVPELALVPEKYIHTPWEMPQEIQTQSGCRIGTDYPEPIIDHKYARQRTIETFKKARQEFG